MVATSQQNEEINVSTSKTPKNWAVFLGRITPQGRLSRKDDSEHLRENLTKDVAQRLAREALVRWKAYWKKHGDTKGWPGDRPMAFKKLGL